MTQLRVGWLSAAAYSGMFGFGIVMALLGAVLPMFVNRAHFSLATVGNLFLAMNAAMLVITVLLGPVLDRFGIKLTMQIAPVVVAVAVIIIAHTQTGLGLTVGAVLLGAGGGALNQATNTLVADLHEDPARKNAALNVLGVFFGFGALFLPFAIGLLLATLHISTILDIAAALILVPVVLSTIERFPPARQAGARGLGDVTRLLRDPLVLTFAFLLFFESGNEFTLGGYISSYLTRELGASLSMASYLLAGYWGAIMVGRFVLGRVLLRMRGEILIRFSAAGVAICIVILTVLRSLPAAGAIAVLLGFAIAAIFPTVLGVAGAQYASHSGTVFGILIGIALAGGMTMPWATGHLAAAHNLRAALWLPAAGACAIVLLEIWSESLVKARALD